MDENTQPGSDVPLDRGVTALVICDARLLDITQLVTTTGRRRAIARERMRLTAQTYWGNGMPQFAGRRIMRVPTFNVPGRALHHRHYYLPIVAK